MPFLSSIYPSSFPSSLSLLCSFPSFLPFIALAKTSDTTLARRAISFLILQEVISACLQLVWHRLWTYHKEPLLFWGKFPLYIIFWSFFIMKDIEFYQILSLLRWSDDFNPSFYWYDGYHYWFAHVEPSFHPWRKSHLITVYNLSYVLLDLTC
jgi:hypothetical protein